MLVLSRKTEKNSARDASSQSCGADWRGPGSRTLMGWWNPNCDNQPPSTDRLLPQRVQQLAMEENDTKIIEQTCSRFRWKGDSLNARFLVHHHYNMTGRLKPEVSSLHPLHVLTKGQRGLSKPGHGDYLTPSSRSRRKKTVNYPVFDIYPRATTEEYQKNRPIAQPTPSIKREDKKSPRRYRARNVQYVPRYMSRKSAPKFPFLSHPSLPFRRHRSLNRPNSSSSRCQWHHPKSTWSRWTHPPDPPS